MAWPTKRKTAAPRGRAKARTASKSPRKAKRYSGCSMKAEYTIRSGSDAGLVVQHPVYSLWRKDRGQPLITGVGVPHKEDFIVKSKKGNEWHKYCFTITQGVQSQLTTGFVNPRTHTIHLPYLGNGFIASPTMGKTKGGAFFHPTGKKR